MCVYVCVPKNNKPNNKPCSIVLKCLLIIAATVKNNNNNNDLNPFCDCITLPACMIMLRQRQSIKQHKIFCFESHFL